MAETGEEHTLGNLGMGALNSDEAIEFDEQGQPVKEYDAEGNEKDLTEQNSQETQNNGEENPLKDELSDFKEGSKESQGEGTKSEESPSEEGSPASSPYYPLASALRDEGALQNVSDEKLKEINDARSLVDLLTEEFESSKKNYIQNLEGTAREVADAIEKGVPLEDFQKAKAEEQEYTKLSESDLEDNEEKQKEILISEFKNRGFSEDRAKKFAEDLEHTGDLESEAKNSLKTLQEEKKKETERLKEQAEEERKRVEENRKQQLSELHKNIQEKNEIIPGLEVQGTMKDKVYESMTTPVAQDDGGNPLDAVMEQWMNDPEYPIKVHYLHQLTNGFTDFSKLLNTSKKEAIKDLERSVSTAGHQAPGKPKEGPNPDQGKDWSSILNKAMGDEE